VRLAADVMRVVPNASSSSCVSVPVELFCRSAERRDVVDERAELVVEARCILSRSPGSLLLFCTRTRMSAWFSILFLFGGRPSGRLVFTITGSGFFSNSGCLNMLFSKRSSASGET